MDVGDTDPEMSEYSLDEATYDNEQPEAKTESIEIENFDLTEYLKKYDTKATSSNGDQHRSISVSAEEAHQAKRKRLDKDAIIGEACQEMSILLHNAKQHFTPPSPNQVFFNSVALQVEQAKLPPMDLMRLQQRILELITQEILLYQERAYTLES